MSARHRRTRRSAAILAVLTLAGLPASAAAGTMQDGPGPRAEGSVSVVMPERVSDMHASTAQAAAAEAPKQDLRSPDAVDAGQGRGTFSAPEVTVVKIPEPVSAPASSGLDWADAGIGAGTILALVLLAGGAAFAVQHHRRSPTAA